MWQADVESQAIKVRAIMLSLEPRRLPSLHSACTSNRANEEYHRSVVLPVVSICSILRVQLETVKTLAIRGTAEENMVARKHTLKGNTGKLPRLIEEAGMRHFIQNPTFIDSDPDHLPVVDVPLFSFPETPEEPSAMNVDVDVQMSDKVEEEASSDAMVPTVEKPRIRKVRLLMPLHDSEGPSEDKRTVKKPRVVSFAD